jgi:predicted enzyme related to lactoylglutathione lyase
MPERKSHANGSFCWPEIATTDRKRSDTFYGELFGWDIRNAPGGFYGIAHLKDRAVAGIYELMPDQVKQGVPSHWAAYVKVASADASATKAAELGGKILAAPFDVPGIGRMAVLEDPTGACVSLWEARGFEGSSLVDEPGAPCWYELGTTDAAKAKAFYSALFGWTWKDSPGYSEFNNGSLNAGGMMAMGPEQKGIPSHWRVYIQVPDCDAVAKACMALGGQVHVPPMDIPCVGRFAVLNAPDGAYFSVIRMGGC